MAAEALKQRLAAILAADAAGYSRLMSTDERATIAALDAARRVFRRQIEANQGRVIDMAGDSVLAVFETAAGATTAALGIQQELERPVSDVPEDRRLRFRIGVHLGDVIEKADGTVYGDGVNIAARVQTLADAGGVAVSDAMKAALRGKVAVTIDDLGEQIVKNIAEPVRVFLVRAGGLEGAKPASNVAGGVPPIDEKPFARSLSIVVLPFVNLSNDPDQEYFADGIVEDLTTDLSRIPHSFVIARNTAFSYKGKSADVRQIGRDLGVRYALEGSVRRIGEHLRINVQLLDAETGAHLWADRFDTDRAGLTDAEDQIAGRLARMLNLQLVEAAARRVERQRSVDPDLRDLVMRGWAAYYRPKSAPTTREAREFFEQALAIDPQSVDAMVGLALNLVHALADGRSNSPPEDEARASQLLAAALVHDVNHAMAHVAIGLLRRYQNRLAEALTELEIAVELDRNNADSLRQLAITLLFLGEPQAAIPHLERAIRLNPRDPNLAAYLWPLGQCHLLLEQVDEAIALLRKARAAWPGEYFLHLNLAGALGLKGDLDEARVALAEALRLKPEVNSLAKYRAATPWMDNPRHWALREKTLNAGLRRAGFPDN